MKRYLKHHRGSEKLGAPLGDENRLCQFPPLRSHSMWVENTAENPKSEGDFFTFTRELRSLNFEISFFSSENNERVFGVFRSV